MSTLSATNCMRFSKNITMRRTGISNSVLRVTESVANIRNFFIFPSSMNLMANIRSMM